MRASGYFHLLFLTFPNLSGKHVSFAANESQIFINWGFLTTGGPPNTETFVPATDIFCLKDGLVNDRLATFDILTLVDALNGAYGHTTKLLETIWLWHKDPNYAATELAKLKSAAHARVKDAQAKVKDAAQAKVDAAQAKVKDAQAKVNAAKNALPKLPTKRQRES